MSSAGMQQIHRATMMDQEQCEPDDEEAQTPDILKTLFADVQDKGFSLTRSWGELLGSLSKYQGKLMVTQNSYGERERRVREQEEKLKQQTGSLPEEVAELTTTLSCKEKMLAACQTELVHVNKMAELVDAEHTRTKEVLEKVLREKAEMEDKCAQYEIDLNSMSQKLQASQEELEIKDQLVAKLEQQMVKEIAESMSEITSLKGLLESREELLEDEKKAHNQTNVRLRQLQISYQALKRSVDSSAQYGSHYPMMPFHSSGDEAMYYSPPGPSNMVLWRPSSIQRPGMPGGPPPAKVRRVVTNTSTTEMVQLDDNVPQFPLHHGLFDFDSTLTDPQSHHTIEMPPSSGRGQDERGNVSMSDLDTRDEERFENHTEANNRGATASRSSHKSAKNRNADDVTSSVLDDVRSRVKAFKESLKQKQRQVLNRKDGPTSPTEGGSVSLNVHALLSRQRKRARTPSVISTDTDVTEPSLDTPTSAAYTFPRMSREVTSVAASPLKLCSVRLDRIKPEKFTPKKSARTTVRLSPGTIRHLNSGDSRQSTSEDDATGLDRNSEPLNVNKTCKAAKCSACKKVFPSMAMYMSHAKKDHPGMDLFRCELCDTSFPDAYRLQYHTKHRKCPTLA